MSVQPNRSAAGKDTITQETFDAQFHPRPKRGGGALAARARAMLADMHANGVDIDPLTGRVIPLAPPPAAAPGDDDS